MVQGIGMAELHASVKSGTTCNLRYDRLRPRAQGRVSKSAADGSGINFDAHNVPFRSLASFTSCRLDTVLSRIDPRKSSKL